MAELTTQEKIELITRDLQEITGLEKLEEIMGERPLKIYWGTATTGKPHLGYFVPVIKIGEFLNAGCEVTILWADLHAFLDSMKSTWELLEARTKVYELMITGMLERMQVPLDKLIFVRGTDFQLGKEYSLDVYRMAAITTLRNAQKAGSEVIKQLESPLISSLLYPMLQALDEEYLKVDAQFGGVDQRKIFMFAQENLPTLGYEKRIHLMNPLIPGLGKSGKMSSSEPGSKIDLDDSPETIAEKVNKAFSVDGEIEGNGLLAVTKYILFKWLEQEGRELHIDRPEQWGGNVSYSKYEELERDFVAKSLSSIDLKAAVARELVVLLAPIKEKMDRERALIERAYPLVN